MAPKQTFIIDRVFHWLSALSILYLLLSMGTQIHNVDYRIKGVVSHKQDAIEIHMLIAFVLFLSLVSRLVWYNFFLADEYKLKYESKRHKLFVRTVHTSMYLALFFLMFSGLIMVNNYDHPLNILGLFNLSVIDVNNSEFLSANSWHLIFESFIYFLIFVHFCGAMYNRR